MNNILLEEIENYKKLLEYRKDGDSEILKKYLTKKNINGLLLEDNTYYSLTPLEMCIEIHDDETMTFLLNNGANPNIYKESYTEYGFWTSLHFSISAEGEYFSQDFVDQARLEPIELLIKYGADINILTSNGYTTLDIADHYFHYPAIEYFQKLGISRKEDIYKKDKIYQQYKRLIELINSEQLEAIKQMGDLSSWIDKLHPYKFIDTIFHYIIKSVITPKRVQIFQYLSEHSTNLNQFNTRPLVHELTDKYLYESLDTECETMYSSFIKSGGNINQLDHLYTKLTPLDRAIISGNDHKIRFLKSLGAKESNELKN